MNRISPPFPNINMNKLLVYDLILNFKNEAKSIKSFLFFLTSYLKTTTFTNKETSKSHLSCSSLLKKLWVLFLKQEEKKRNEAIRCLFMLTKVYIH